jgi:hypothetical protein
VEERQQVLAEHVLGGVGGGFVHRSPVALVPIAREFVKTGILLARIELERGRRSPCAATDQARDLVAPIGCAHVVPSLPLGAKRDPVALSIRPHAQPVGVLTVALAVALDDRTDRLGSRAVFRLVAVMRASVVRWAARLYARS